MAFRLEERDVLIFGADFEICMDLANEFFLEKFLLSFDLLAPEKFGALNGYNRLDTVVWLVGDYKKQVGYEFLKDACKRFQIEMVDMNEREINPCIIYDASILLH
jgi:hypothetical protein